MLQYDVPPYTSEMVATDMKDVRKLISLKRLGTALVSQKGQPLCPKTLLAHLCALMHVMRSPFSSSSQSEPTVAMRATTSEGGAHAKESEEEQQEATAAIVARREGKWTVLVCYSTNGKHNDGEHGPVIKKVYEKSSREAYASERDNLKALKGCGLEVADSASFDDDTMTITFGVVGHRLRLASDAEFAEAQISLQSQLETIWKAGRQHGDVSALNMIMRVTGVMDEAVIRKCIDESWARVEAHMRNPSEGQSFLDSVLETSALIHGQEACEYFLIDFGSSEAIGAESHAYSVHSSFPGGGFHVPPKERDTFSLLASLLEIAAESDEYPYPRLDIDGHDAFYEERTDYFKKVAAPSSGYGPNRRLAATQCLELLEEHA